MHKINFYHLFIFGVTICSITRIKNVWPKSIYFIALDQINTHLKISVSEKVISSMFGNFGKEKEFAMFRSEKKTLQG